MEGSQTSTDVTEELLALLDEARATDDDIIVSLADLVDRGPDSAAVLRFLCEGCARGLVRSLRPRGAGW